MSTGSREPDVGAMKVFLLSSGSSGRFGHAGRHFWRVGVAGDWRERAKALQY
jgi:hypothetical protein